MSVVRDKTVDTSVRVDQVFERGNRRELRMELAKSLESASAEDLDEVLALSDRIAVMYEGRILATVDGDAADVALIGQLMGGHREPAT